MGVVPNEEIYSSLKKMRETLLSMAIKKKVTLDIAADAFWVMC